jgi:hypothetical protein
MPQNKNPAPQAGVNRAEHKADFALDPNRQPIAIVVARLISRMRPEDPRSQYDSRSGPQKPE